MPLLKNIALAPCALSHYFKDLYNSLNRVPSLPQPPYVNLILIPARNSRQLRCCDPLYIPRARSGENESWNPSFLGCRTKCGIKSSVRGNSKRANSYTKWRPMVDLNGSRSPLSAHSRCRQRRHLPINLLVKLLLTSERGHLWLGCASPALTVAKTGHRWTVLVFWDTTNTTA